MESGAKGCEVVVSGKLRAARAKSMKFTVSLSLGGIRTRRGRNHFDGLKANWARRFEAYGDFFRTAS